MAELKYKPVPHDHKAFLAKARSRKGFNEAYDALAAEYQVAGQMLKARSRAGLTQDAVAERMGKRDRPEQIRRPVHDAKDLQAEASSQQAGDDHHDE